MKLCRDAKRLTAFSLISITACLVMSACAGLGASSTQPILPDGRLFTQVGFIDTSAQDALIRSYLKSPSSTNQDKLDLTIYIEVMALLGLCGNLRHPIPPLTMRLAPS